MMELKGLREGDRKRLHTVRLVGDRYMSEWIRRNPRMVESFFEAILRGL